MKTSKTLLALVTLFSVPSFGFIQDLNDLKNQMAKQSATQKVRPMIPKTCVNFSGKWEGACTTDGQKTNASLEINQSGCSEIRLKSQDSSTSYELSGSGLKTESTLGVGSSFSSSVGLHWDSKGETIQAGVTATYNSPYVDHVVTLMGEAQLMFDETDLVLISKITGNMPIPSQNVCRYSKVK